VSASLIKTKLFFDEFFDISENREQFLLPENLKTYDLKNNDANEKFLGSSFVMSPSILPIQNMGEIAFVTKKYKDAFTLLDLCLKLYKTHDFQNLLKFKVLTLLGSLLETQGDLTSTHKIHETIFKQLENVPCYEKVFATRNYGYLLAKHDETRLEGQDLIKKSDELQQAFPYWAERKMGLFVPVMQPVDEANFLKH